MHPEGMSPRNTAFTRLELMLVAVLTGVLVSIVLAAVARSRARAQEAQCLGNLKGVGTAFQLWLHDAEDRMPWQMPVEQKGSQGLPLLSQHYRALSNQLASPRVLACPGLARYRPAAVSFPAMGDPNVSYPLNLDLAGVPSASRLLMADYDIQGIGGKPEQIATCARAGGIRVSVLETSYGGSASLQLAWSGTNHLGRGNILDVDGTVMTADDGSLKRVLSLQGGQLLHLLRPQR